MIRLLVFWICVFSSSFTVVFSQTTVVVRLSNRAGENIIGATISLISERDSTVRWIRVTDTAGTARFPFQAGKYRLIAEVISYRKINKVITLSSTEEVKLIMEQDASTMQGVVITGRKPLMRQEDDKTIVDPEPIVLGSTSAYEVMEKIPGLFMDQEGNIYLNSTSPSAIWINGREQRMGVAEIAVILKSLPPNSIDRIELIRTPSARYDASGGGGIVNVILKKNIRIGLTGSLSAGFNQGTYGNQFTGFNLTNSDGKTSSYLNTNLNLRNNFDQINTTRQIGIDSLLNQYSRTQLPGKGIYVGGGVNREFTSKFTAGFDTRISLNSSQGNNENPTEFFRKGSEVPYFSNASNTNTRSRSVNLNQAFSAKLKLDTIGSEWNHDLSYSYDPGNSKQKLGNEILIPVFIRTDLNGETNNQSHFLIYQSNLVKKLKGKLVLETGLKSANLFFGNDTKYFFNRDGELTADKRRTNSYDYDEHIHAGYLQASKTMGPVVLKTGLRIENTNMIGKQTIPQDTSFTLRRTDAFPYVYLSRTLLKILNYELRGYLVYRRTISRPSYNYLNPAIRILDPFLYETGNPSLRPQFTQNYEANISVDERPLFAVGVNETKDIFSQVLYQADSTKSIAYRTYDNTGRNRETYFRGIAAIPPGRKYFFVVGTQYNLNRFEGQYEGKPLLFRRGTWTVFSFQTLKITKTTQLSLQGFVRFKGQLQFYELSTFGALNANISQQLMKRKLTLTISANDILYTNKNNFLLTQGSVLASGNRFSDTRRFGMNLRYNFGIRKKEKSTNLMEDIDAVNNLP
jgi:hypothetical protein